MKLVDQWRQIERGLPEDWGDARLLLTLSDERHADRAAALLGPIGPGRRGRRLRFYTARRGAGHRPDLIRRLLARLDAERIDGQLELVSSGKPEPTVPREVVRPTLAASWDAALAALPSDWSDAYAEVELRSSDHLDRAALLLSPLNPARYGRKPGFRFRAARRFGYGVAPEMARRCFERLDAEGIRGNVRILHALSDTRPVQTQGPVWYVGGRAV
jgi:hypothetical protein